MEELPEFQAPEFLTHQSGHSRLLCSGTRQGWQGSSGHAPQAFFFFFFFPTFTRLLLRNPRYVRMRIEPLAWTTPYRDILHTHHGAISERIALLARMCHVDHLYRDVGLSVCTPVFCRTSLAIPTITSRVIAVRRESFRTRKEPRCDQTKTVISKEPT